MNLQPTQDKVLVKLEPVDEKIGNLYVPDSAKEKPQYGIVFAVGRGRYSEKGVLIPTSVKVNDKVLINNYGTFTVKIEGVEYKILSEDEILAIID